jgi:hypothetical protein
MTGAAAMNYVRPTPSELRAGEAAAWGAVKRRMQLLVWRALRKGALRGFATVELPSGLRLIDCPVCVNGRAWANLPGQPLLDKDGRQQLDARGKGAYCAVLLWRSRELQDQWSQAVVALVRAAHPGDLDEG